MSSEQSRSQFYVHIVYSVAGAAVAALCVVITIF